ncbi:MAG: hypothetical protein ACLFN1_08160 [Bacteroidales bacterium]
MDIYDKIPKPLNFNPLKHHLGYIRSFTSRCSLLDENRILSDIIPLLKHIGSSVADIYTGNLGPESISSEILLIMKQKDLTDEDEFINWINQSKKGYRKCILSDLSVWILKYLDNNPRYLHFFPGRNIEKTVRSRGNSLKTAMLFDILYDKGDILLTDLNDVRRMLALSPVRNIEAASGIISDIRLLQSANNSK